MHTIVEPTRAGIFVPLENRERIALYRARIDETSEFHRDRALAGLAMRATWGMAPLPAAASSVASRSAFIARRSHSAAADRRIPPSATAAGLPSPAPGGDVAPGTDTYADAREYAHAAACAELDPTA